MIITFVGATLIKFINAKSRALNGHQSFASDCIEDCNILGTGRSTDKMRDIRPTEADE